MDITVFQVRPVLVPLLVDLVSLEQSSVVGHEVGGIQEPLPKPYFGESRVVHEPLLLPAHLLTLLLDHLVNVLESFNSFLVRSCQVYLIVVVPRPFIKIKRPKGQLLIVYQDSFHVQVPVFNLEHSYLVLKQVFHEHVVLEVSVRRDVSFPSRYHLNIDSSLLGLNQSFVYLVHRNIIRLDHLDALLCLLDHF